MIVILYAKAGDPNGDQLKQLLETHVPGIEVESCETLLTLTGRLSQAGQDPSLVILLCTNHKDLTGVFPIRRWLQNIGIILILPDSDPETIALGHQLRPRFLTDIQQDFMIVAAVVEKLLKIPTERLRP